MLPIVSVEPGYEAAFDAHARQACRVCTSVPPPPDFRPPPEDPNFWAKPLQDAFNDIDDAIDNTVHNVTQWGSQFVPKDVSTSDLKSESEQDLKNQGFKKDPKSGEWKNSRGETAGVGVSGNTTSSYKVTPSWQDPKKPSSVTVSKKTVNPDGTVTRVDTTVSYSYSLMGDPIETTVTIRETGKPKKQTTIPDDGGGGGGGDDEQEEHNPYDTTEDGTSIPGHRSGDASKPTGLKANRYSGTSGEIMWNRTSNSGSAIVGYRIIRDGKSLGVKDVLSWYQNDLRKGRSYVFEIRSIDKRGRESAGAKVTLRG